MSVFTDRTTEIAPSRRTAVFAAPLLILAIILAAEYSFFVQFSRGLLGRPQYQFFPIMILGAAYIGFERWQTMAFDPVPGKRWISRLLLCLSCLALFTGGRLLVRSFSSVSLTLLLAGMLWRIGGFDLLRAMAPSIVILLAITPPPSHLDDTLTLNLQYLAVRLSSHILDALHVPQVQSGNVLDIPGRRLLIEQACSGINSLLSIMGFSLLYGFFRRRRTWQIGISVACSMFFVIFANVTRITTEAFLKVRCNIDVLDGAAHELLGLLTFAVAALLTVSLDSLFDAGHHGAQALLPPLRRARFRGRLGVYATDWAIAAAFVVTGLYVYTQIHDSWRSPNLRTDARFELPPVIAGWQRLDKGSFFTERPQTTGVQSTVWVYKNGDSLASVAVDYPFVDYHDLTVCYRASGWKISSTSFETTDAPHGNFTRVELRKPSGQQGYLLFGLINEQGHWIDPRAGVISASMPLWLQGTTRDAAGAPTYQTQVLITSYAPLTQEQRRSTDELYLASRQILGKQVIDQLEAR